MMSNLIRRLRGVISYPAHHLRWKIITPYMILALALAVCGTYLVTKLITGSLQERFNNQIAAASTVASDSLVRRERKHLETVRGVAFSDGVAAATEQKDGFALARLVDPIAANARAERVEVLGASGHRVYGAYLADASSLTYGMLDEPDNRGSWQIVRSVMAASQDQFGDKFAQVVETPSGYALYTAGPIYEGTTLAGVVLVGSMLPSLLPSMKTEAAADVTVYDFNGTALATTLPPGKDASEVDLTPDPRALADGPGVIRQHKMLYGRGYELLYGKLVIRNQEVGVYSVALPSSFIVNAASATRWQLGILFAAATVVVLLTGLLIARSLTRPLIRLVTVAQAVTEGNLGARSEITTADEVGALAGSFDIMTERLQQQHLATIRALTGAIDARDPYTLGHSVRVGQLAVALGAELGLPESALQHLEIGGYLHDIGKIGVRDAVLLKPANLTAEEREMIERHPRIGLEILAPVQLAPEVIEFVAGHHEKLDGSGYPSHAHGDQLSIIARIAAVADIYDALTTDRPYRGAMSLAESFDIMLRETAEGHLDASVFTALTRIVDAWEERRQTDPALKGYQLPDYPHAEAA